MNLAGRHFLTLKDFTPEEINYFVDLAADLKAKKKQGIPVDVLHGKNVALIWIQRLPRLARKKASKIRHVYLEECLIVLNTVDMDRIL